MSRLLRREAGYSLVEMLTVMMIMSVVMAGLTQVFVSGSKAEVDMGKRFQAQQEGRLALDKIRRDIHCASAGAVASVTGPPTTYKLTLTTACVSGGVAWCTVSVGGSSTRFALYRQTGGTTCGSASPAVRIADYLTSANAFPTYTAQSTTSLASLAVDFPVSVTGSAVGAYRLKDTIFLRNSTRS